MDIVKIKRGTPLKFEPISRVMNESITTTTPCLIYHIQLFWPIHDICDICVYLRDDPTTTTRRGFIGQASLDQTFDTAKSIFSTEKSCSHSFLICLDSVRRIKYGFLCLLTHWHVIDRHEAWGFGQVDQMDPVIFDIMQFSKPIFDNYNQNCIKIPPSRYPTIPLFPDWLLSCCCLSICQQHSAAAWQIMCTIVVIFWFYRAFFFFYLLL